MASTAHIAAEASAASKAAASASRGGMKCAIAMRSAATASGTAMVSGTSAVMSSSPFVDERPQLLRIEGLVLARNLQRHGEEERGDGGADDDIGQHERLHHRIDGWRAGRMIVKDRRHRAPLIADAEQQDISRRLTDRETADEVNEIAARHDAVDANAEEPRCDEPRQHAHRSFSVSAARVSSMNSRNSIAKPDRKSTRLNSSHQSTSYAVFCLKKKKQ